MKFLLDACVPRLLRQFLPDHTIDTAQERGWGQMQNGDLLQAEDRSPVTEGNEENEEGTGCYFRLRNLYGRAAPDRKPFSFLVLASGSA